MAMFEIAAKCTNCGKWKGVQTTNPSKYIMRCVYCNKHNALRNKAGWNVIVHNPQGKPLDEVIRGLNEKEDESVYR